MRSAQVLMRDQWAGTLAETVDGFEFTYRPDYRANADAEAVSLTLPLNERPYRSKVLFPFFDGLIPEGWLLTVAEKSWKLDPRDRMGLLLVCCKDCIGAVSIEPMDNPKADGER
ncbi:MAG: HipA N-terminal domain-containing protein [Bacteroidetes bacterium]|nr:HipA N-terminal domain-containing protein [Bacteroidota bacterium]